MALPDWKLPPGITRALWEYAHQPHIARDYDRSIESSKLARYDESLLARTFLRPGRMIDLGCGTGRLAVQFAARGFDVVGVDLSLEMLRMAREKSQSAGVQIALLAANLCELDCIPDKTFDYALSMFSTLGMISGEANRSRALEHVRRILNPGGRLALHIHNVWHNVFDPHGRRWLANDRIGKLLGRHPGGDRVTHDRGIPHAYMHVFSLGEAMAMLRAAGLQIEHTIPLTGTGSGPLRYPWLGGSLRAGGWIFIASRP